MVDLVALSSRKHIENLESEALKASDSSQLFKNVDKVLGISSLKNQVKQGEYSKAALSIATSPEVADVLDGSTHKANLTYQSSNLESLEQMMHYQMERSSFIMKKIKEHPQAEKLFERVDELCHETSTNNIVELMTTKYENPEVSSTINELNTIINKDQNLKKDFDDFQKEYSKFVDTQKTYTQELVDQLENDQLTNTDRNVLLQHASDKVNNINDDFNKVLEDGKNIPVYNQTKDEQSPMVIEQHENLISNKEVTYQNLQNRIENRTNEPNVQNKNHNHFSL